MGVFAAHNTGWIVINIEYAFDIETDILWQLNEREISTLFVQYGVEMHFFVFHVAQSPQSHTVMLINTLGNSCQVWIPPMQNLDRIAQESAKVETKVVLRWQSANMIFVVPQHFPQRCLVVVAVCVLMLVVLPVPFISQFAFCQISKSADSNIELREGIWNRLNCLSCMSARGMSSNKVIATLQHLKYLIDRLNQIG